MNEEYNLHPYHNQTDSLANIMVTPLMIEHLRATKPWVRFLSIVMFIMVALIFLAGLMMLVSTSAPVGMSGSGIGSLAAIIYWIMGGLYIAPAIFLYRFASSIDDLLRGGGDTALEMALESQKSFWRFTGIVTLIVICIYALMIMIAILGLMSMRRF